MVAYLFTDGGSRGNPGPAGIACILLNEAKQLIGFDGKYIDTTTNNQAEYQALELGLKLAAKAGVTELHCFLDSELVVKQLKGEYKIKDAGIKSNKQKIDELIKAFGKIDFKHVPREQNKFADKLVNIILDAKQS